jgi:hypothetical protein
VPAGIERPSGRRPSVVVAAHDDGAARVEERDAAGHVTGAVDDVADAEDAVDAPRRMIERCGQPPILGMDVTDEEQAAQHPAIMPYSSAVSPPFTIVS